jgi:DNA-binding Lrp family transcriptional regulator
MFMRKIAIRSLERPDTDSPEALLKWFCTALGLSANDSDDIEEKILKELFYSARANEGISSSEMNLDTDLSRSTVIYHLNRLIETGIAVKRGRKYYLRANEMSKVIEELEYDIEREMQRMLDVAKEFDSLMQPRPNKAVKK